MRPAALVVALGVLAACSSAEDAASPGVISCQQTSDCPLGMLCRMPSGTCEAEPTNGVAGRFSCLLGSTTQPGSTDVTGYLGELRLNVNGVSRCTIDSLNGNLVLDFLSSTVLGGKQHLVRAYLAPDTASTKEVVLGAGIGSSAANAGLVAEYDDAGNYQRTVGFTSVGRVTLDVAPVEGQQLSGYIEVTFELARQGTVVGVPCPRGAADCTDSLFSLDPVFCSTEGMPGGNGPICLSKCSTDADCAKYGGFCVDGVLCAKACSLGSATDCAAPLECVEYAPGINFCF